MVINFNSFHVDLQLYYIYTETLICCIFYNYITKNNKHVKYISKHKWNSHKIYVKGKYAINDVTEN